MSCMYDTTSDVSSNTPKEVLTPTSEQWEPFEASETLTAEALVSLQCPQHVRLSPSGRHVVYSLQPVTNENVYPKSALWVAQSGQIDSARSLTSGAYLDESPHWCPKDEVIAFVSNFAKQESSAIYLVSATGLCEAEDTAHCQCSASLTESLSGAAPYGWSRDLDTGAEIEQIPAQSKFRCGTLNRNSSDDDTLASTNYRFSTHSWLCEREREAYSVTPSNNEQKISSIAWSPNGQYIAFLSADEVHTNRKSSHNNRDDAFVYRSEWKYSRLRVVCVDNLEVITLVKGYRHVTCFSWNSTSDQLVFVSQMTPDINCPWYKGVDVALVSLHSPESTNLFHFPGPVSDLTWCGLYLYFLSGKTPDRQSTAGTIYRCTQEGQDTIPYAFGDQDCAVRLKATTGFPFAQVQQGLNDQIYLLSGSSPIMMYCGNHEITTWDIVSLDDSRFSLVIGKGSTSSPTEIFSVSEVEKVQLSQHGHAIATLQIASESPFYVSADDGTDLDGVLLRPAQTGAMPWPTVIAVHGGPMERVTFAFDIPLFHWAPWLASRGYAVLCPNYRGSTSHGEAFASHSKGGVGTKDYDDIITMIQEGIRRGIIDPTRVAICGYSQGGFLSYLAVTRPDFQFRAAVCAGGVTDWDMLTMSSDFPSLQSELAGGAPWAMRSSDKSTRHASAIWHMRNIRTPILMLHAEEDERIPLTQATAFHRGCVHHGIPCELVVYPREPHLIMERAHRLDMLRRIEDFFALHLG